MTKQGLLFFIFKTFIHVDYKVREFCSLQNGFNTLIIYIIMVFILRG